MTYDIVYINKQYYYNFQINVTVIMDDELGDKGWDGDMGNEDVR